MKKLALTLAVVLGLSMTTFAEGGGLFQRGGEQENNYYTREGSGIVLPGHGESENQNGGEPAPLGTGIAVLTALGAAYLVGKKRNEE